METHYAILEIEESATPEEIKNAHRLLLQVWHPDRFHQTPKLLAKAEEKTGKINRAFETLGNPDVKQQYDEWLRANRNWGVQTVGPVTCPSCQTSFSSGPERSEKREFRPNRHQGRKDSGHTAGARPDEHHRFTPLRMAILAIGVLFSGAIVFAITKPSKVIVSYKPARAVEQAALPGNEPSALQAEEQIRQAAAVRNGVSGRPAQPDEREPLPKDVPKGDSQQERSRQLESMQRLMAQVPGRTSAAPADMISDVDLQQLKMRGAQGNASAQNQLGQMFADGRGVPQDYKKARQWWEQAAAQSVAQAQYNLGQLYANGRGVPQDYTTARGWYEKAAAQGNAWAQAQLGQLYANGRGVPKDDTAARGWYEKAAAQGNAWAQAQLALL